jgi:hypothetical protein
MKLYPARSANVPLYCHSAPALISCELSAGWLTSNAVVSFCVEFSTG